MFKFEKIQKLKYKVYVEIFYGNFLIKFVIKIIQDKDKEKRKIMLYILIQKINQLGIVEFKKLIFGIKRIEIDIIVKNIL